MSNHFVFLFFFSELSQCVTVAASDQMKIQVFSVKIAIYTCVIWVTMDNSVVLHAHAQFF